MHEILEWELNSVVYFNKAKATTGKGGLTFVRGANLDSDPANPTGNGAGKSLLFSTIPNVYYFSPPLAIKKKAKKELLGRKGASIRIKQKAPDGNIYDITQLPSKYVIKKNGEDLQLRTVPMSEQFIRNIFPLSEVEFYTTCFVSTQKLYPFQNDSDLQRLEHLISVFGLDNYERLKQYFADKLRGIKDLEVRLSVLEQRRSTVKESLEKSRATFDPETTRKLKAEIKDLGRQLKASQAHEHDLHVQVRDLQTLLTIEEELDGLRSSYGRKDHPKDAIPILKSELRSIRIWEKYNSSLKTYTKTKATLSKRLEAIELPTQTKKQLKAQLDLLEKDIQKLEKSKRGLEEDATDYDRATAVLRAARTKLEDLDFNIKSDKPDTSDVGDLIAQCRTTLKLRSLIEHEEHDGKCPTCLSEINIANIRKAVKKAEAQLPELQRKQCIQEAYKSYVEHAQAVKKLSFDPAALKEVTTRLKKVKADLDEAKDGLRLIADYDSIKMSIDDLECPTEPKEKLKTKLSYEEVEEKIELCTEIIKHLATKNKLLAANPSLTENKSAKAVEKEMGRLTDDLSEAEEAHRQVRETLAKRTTDLERLSSAESELALFTSEYKKVRKEIADIKPQIENKQVLDVLVKAYGSKGLRTIAANKICTLLESNLNHYRGLVFAEPFVFSVTASEGGMSIIVDRGNNMVSDVRNLSGAESNCFRLLFVLSILPLIPGDRRVNMLVLDEPTSHQDEVNRAIFRERYLPALREVVPSIFVITPHADDYVPESNEWLVQKREGVSRLITSSVIASGIKEKRSK